MATVTATAEAVIDAAPAAVVTALSDYAGARREILTPAYTDYDVLEGGTGTGTVVTWRLHATKKRVRHVVADVTVVGDAITEKDRNSTMATVFSVTPVSHGEGQSRVLVTTTWEGAGGIGGFFERTFAPGGLRTIHTELLANLAARLGA